MPQLAPRVPKRGQKSDWPKLTPYGNYERGKVPKRGVYEIPLNGSVRIAHRLGIETREVVTPGPDFRWHRCGYVIRTRDKRKFAAALAKSSADAERRKSRSPHPDLLLCISEASRAAHRARDAAQNAYYAGRHRNAGNHSSAKRKWYALKERGIVEAHRRGLLLYAGAAPDGMAVYEYGEGGMQCFHSTLHPTDRERRPVPDHPDRLLVPAKDKVKGVSLDRVRLTLESCPPIPDSYERSLPPRVEREPNTCWNCGGDGHVARDCDL